MRTEHLAPLFTDWKPHRTVRAHAWTAKDSQLGGTKVRDIYHYTTRMGAFTDTENGDWVFRPVSVGVGSVSDAQGMNKIVGRYGWSMRRDQKGGGPRWLYNGSEQPIAPTKPIVPTKPSDQFDKLVLQVLKRAVPA